MENKDSIMVKNTKEELKELETEALLDDEIEVEDSKYADLWANMVDPTLDDVRTEFVLDKLGMTCDQLVKVFESSKKLNKPTGDNANARYMSAIDNSIKAMHIPKRIISALSFDNLTRDEIKATVNQYYSVQKFRVAINNQTSAVERNGGNSEILDVFARQLKTIEDNLKNYLDVYTDRHPVCIWMKSIVGIGPVISAALISYFDITKTQTAGGFWSYAGWAGAESKLKRGVKANYNPMVKTLSWKAASSFKMRNKNPNCYYGKLYQAKKDEYIRKNENGDYKETAAQILKENNYSNDTGAKKAYEEGKLPAGHIDARAIRFCGKIFLSHLFDVWYMYEHGTYPPVPYPISVLGHIHIESVPNFEVIKPYLEKKWPDVVWDDKKIYRRHLETIFDEFKTIN